MRDKFSTPEVLKQQVLNATGESQMIRVNVIRSGLWRSGLWRSGLWRSGLLGALCIFALLALSEKSVAQTNTNPCAATSKVVNKVVNPCAAEMGIKTSLFTRPRGTMLAKGNPADLIKEGKRLFKDKSLSTTGYSCNACHANFGLFNETFAEPYPHKVAMAEKNGMKKIKLDEMVQLCLLGPMESKPLPWNSRKLAALTAYMATIQKGFIAQRKAENATLSPRSGMNPCAAQ